MIIYFEFKAKNPDLAGDRNGQYSPTPEVEQSSESERFPPGRVANVTLKRIRETLHETLPEFDARVAMRFLATDTGIGWQGAVLLVQSRGDLRPAKAIRSFASKAIEAAVDNAVRANRDDQDVGWKGLNDAKLPVTRILEEKGSRESTQESDALMTEWYDSGPTWRTPYPFSSFVTSVFALILSALSFAGFAYLILKTMSN